MPRSCGSGSPILELAVVGGAKGHFAKMNSHDVRVCGIRTKGHPGPIPDPFCPPDRPFFNLGVKQHCAGPVCSTLIDDK